MPLKISCKNCGELLYYMNGDEMATAVIPIPELFSRIKNPCPTCGRRIEFEDMDNFTLKISGEKAKREFFSRYGDDKFKREVLTVFTTEKKSKTRSSSYLVRGHDQ